MGQLRTANKRHNRTLAKTIAAGKPPVAAAVVQPKAGSTK